MCTSSYVEIDRQPENECKEWIGAAVAIVAPGKWIDGGDGIRTPDAMGQVSLPSVIGLERCVGMCGLCCIARETKDVVHYWFLRKFAYVDFVLLIRMTAPRTVSYRR